MSICNMQAQFSFFMSKYTPHAGKSNNTFIKWFLTGLGPNIADEKTEWGEDMRERHVGNLGRGFLPFC